MTFLFLATLASGQSQEEQEFDAAYAKRIQLSRIEGVYIPKSIEDAFVELENLAEPAGIKKFTSTPEHIVASRLNGGIGRWMLINWGFYDGSRLSHRLKSLGAHHPEDMANLLLVSFHRHLNDLPLNIKEQIEVFQQKRKIEYEASHTRDTFRIIE